jgi:hypothetical protein
MFLLESEGRTCYVNSHFYRWKLGPGFVLIARVTKTILYTYIERANMHFQGNRSFAVGGKNLVKPLSSKVMPVFYLTQALSVYIVWSPWLKYYYAECHVPIAMLSVIMRSISFLISLCWVSCTYCYAECHYAEYLISHIVMLSVINWMSWGHQKVLLNVSTWIGQLQTM